MHEEICKRFVNVGPRDLAKQASRCTLALIVVGGALGFGALQLTSNLQVRYFFAFVPASPSQVHHEGPPLQAGYRERAGLPEVQVCWVPERHWTQ